MSQKIHYHTDCPFFAGCENMLVNFWASAELRQKFQITFSYRSTEQYTEGLRQRAQLDFPVYPLDFPDLSYLPSFLDRWPDIVKRSIRFSFRLAFTLPLLAYEIWVLYKLFCALRPDILHINSGGYPSTLSARAAVIAAKLTRVPQTVMVVNNLAVGYQRPSRWPSYLLDRLDSHAVSKFITGSAVAANQLRKVLRLDTAKCVSIHNGIALRKTTETREQTRKRLGLEQFDGIVFGVVAIMRPNKGHQVLLDAILNLLGDIRNGSINIKILLEGSGPLRKALQAFVIDNQLSEYCVFVGDEKNVMDFMAILDVLILPSIDSEDFPNVILEAMGLGKPVIASRLAGTPEQVVDGETGLLVAPRDVDQLAASIARLYFEDAIRAHMGLAGYQRFQRNFMAEVAVKNYISFYQSLN